MKSEKVLLYEYLSQFVTPHRLQRFEEVLAYRTRYITVVLEDLYQPHNISAVLRSCDCFGIQDVHIIENRNKVEINPEIALGASKWLNIYRYNINQESNTPDALNQVRKKGYRIIATTPHDNDILLEEVDLRPGPIALVFGTELRGLSDQAMGFADVFMRIPMYGFTESFNISVSAAISLYHLTRVLHSSDIPWKLTDDEKLEVKINWLKQSIHHSELLVQDFMKKIKENN